METENRVLIIRRIHVRYHLRLGAEQREAAERAHAAHQSRCPVALTLRNSVMITTELGFELDT